MFVRSAVHTEVVHETRFPLIALERHGAELDEALVTRAREELIAGGSDQPAAAGSFRSGFLLGVQADAATHPSCLELAEMLRGPADFSLSFYKLAAGAPPAADEGPFYEGPHLDTHPELTESTELLRLLVNLSEHPRRFRYAATDRWQLAEQGVRYGRREFEPLRLPAEIESRVVEIPGRTKTTLHALRFFASAVPHVGLNDQPEHFLVSFEALASVPSP